MYSQAEQPVPNPFCGKRVCTLQQWRKLLIDHKRLMGSDGPSQTAEPLIGVNQQKDSLYRIASRGVLRYGIAPHGFLRQPILA